MKSPKDILLPYQQDWVRDPARFKLGMWARQTGKSFSTAAETVEDVLLAERHKRKTAWVTLSAGERQALEWMQKAREWTEAYQLAIADYAEERDHPEALMKSAEIVFPGGSRILAIPANPSTARGYSANITLDEFGFHENPDAIWRAMYPSISNPLRQQYKIRIVSTPNGKANKFYDLWTKNEQYSKHLIDIYKAVERGLPLNIEELKAGLDDPDGWAQEYECLFIDDAAVLLPYDLLAPCETEEAIDHFDLALAATGEPCWYGFDVGRKRDLSVLWALRRIGDVYWTAGLRVFEKTPFREQHEFLRRVMQLKGSRRLCIDSTGIGAMMGEELAREFGEGRVEQCVFTAALKHEIFPPLKRQFEDKRLRIPVSRAIREDLHSVQKVTSPGGTVKYTAPHRADGHSDRATALALALRAAEQGGAPFHFAPLRDPGDASRQAPARGRSMPV